MKVLVFGVIFGHGGIQSHLRWLCRALVESGMEVLIDGLWGSICGLWGGWDSRLWC
jgi:hypothetical protein